MQEIYTVRWLGQRHAGNLYCKVVGTATCRKLILKGGWDSDMQESYTVRWFGQVHKETKQRLRWKTNAEDGTPAKRRSGRPETSDLRTMWHA